MEFQPKALLPGWFSLISMACGVSLVFFSMALVPGYRMDLFYVSDLGTTSAATVFGLGLLSSGLFAIPFFEALGNSLKRSTIKVRTVENASIFAKLACIGLCGAGLFPAVEPTRLLHAISALLFFVSGLLFTLLFSRAMWNHGLFSRWQSWHGVAVGCVFLLFLATGVPATEWMVFFAIVSWVIQVGIYMIWKKIGW